jgi:hypothetical protein
LTTEVRSKDMLSSPMGAFAALVIFVFAFVRPARGARRGRRA